MAILPTQHHQPSSLQPRACKCVHANLAALGRLPYTEYDSSTLGPLLVPGPDLPWVGFARMLDDAIHASTHPALMSPRELPTCNNTPELVKLQYSSNKLRY